MNEVRIGIIGASGRGGIAKHWHDPGGRSVVVGASDVAPTALDGFLKHVNEKGFVTQDHRELLDCKDIDAIAVLSPDFTHEQYVCDAFDAGKHVFTEKPMAITTEGCDRMLRAWVDSGKQFMIGFNMRYMNLFRVMKDAIDSGAIGEPKAVWVRHFVGPGGNWYYHDWHAASRNTTGLLLQKASHDIDMIHWLTGQYTVRVAASGGLDYYGGDKPNDLRCPACPEKETCVEYHHVEMPEGHNSMDSCVFREEVDVEDHSIMMLELEGGIRASYTQCHFAPDYWRNYTVIGTEGRIENLDDTSRVILRMRDPANRQNNTDRELAVERAAGGHGGADPEICRDFIDMLVDGKRPLATPLAGRMSVAAAYAATHSLRNGWQPVVVPAVPEDIRDKVF